MITTPEGIWRILFSMPTDQTPFMARQTLFSLRRVLCVTLSAPGHKVTWRPEAPKLWPCAYEIAHGHICGTCLLRHICSGANIGFAIVKAPIFRALGEVIVWIAGVATGSNAHQMAMIANGIILSDSKGSAISSMPSEEKPSQVRNSVAHNRKQFRIRAA